jgi:uncharacterized protein
MKNRELTKLSALRSLLARLHNAESVTRPDDAPETGGPIAGATAGVGSTEAPRKQLTLTEVQAIIQAEIQEIETTLRQLNESSEYAAELREKLVVIHELEIRDN